MKASAYEKITEAVIALMESDGLAPWRKTWKGTKADGPRSMATGKLYQGSNAWWLAMLQSFKGYGSPVWGTYKQIRAQGGQVRKGESSATAVYWNFIEKEDKNGNEKKIPLLRMFPIFNATQADWPEGIPSKFDAEEEEAPSEWSGLPSNEAADAICSAYVDATNGPSFRNGGDRAFYSPELDGVCVPKPAAFTGEGEYWSTVFHELGHSTGHADRLNRPGVADFDEFGSHQYSEEELVAEFTSCFLAAETGIVDTRENSAAYLKHWATKLRADPKLLIRASGRAAKAAAWIMSRGAEV